MDTQLATTEPRTVVLARREVERFEPNEEQRRMIRATYANGASDQEFQVLMEIARARNLNPLLRQIHFVKRWTPNGDVWAPQVSIDGLRAIAERTGLYAGQDKPVFIENTDGTLQCCEVAVWRKDWTRPVYGVAYWAEYVQTTRDRATGKERPAAMWAKMPHVMLAKVAESIALRKAFPEDAGGLYTDDEMGQADNGRPEHEEESRVSRPKARPSLPPSNAPGETVPQDPARGREAPHQPTAGRTLRAVEAKAEEAAPSKAGGSTPPTLADYTAQLGRCAVLDDVANLWRASRHDLAVADREPAWSAALVRLAAVMRADNVKGMGALLKKRIADLDGQEPDPNGPKGAPSRDPAPPSDAHGSGESAANDAAAPQAWTPVVTHDGVTIDDQAGAVAHIAGLNEFALRGSFARHWDHAAWCDLVVKAYARLRRIDLGTARYQLVSQLPAEKRAPRKQAA